MQSIIRLSSIIAKLLIFVCFTGCSICRTPREQPCFDRVIQHNVLNNSEVFRPKIIARKAHCGYIVIASQEDLPKITQSNTLYILKADINLHGKLLKIPCGSLLFFDGGSFSNGTVEGDHTVIVSKDYEIFKHGISTYRAYKADTYKYVTRNHNAIVVAGTWLNTSCGSSWTGMLDQDDSHCSSLSINNFIKLHKQGQEIVFPKNKIYYVYDHIICSGYSIDFNNSVICSIDFDRVEDSNIRLEDGVQSKDLESLYGLVVFIGDNLSLKNVTIDGRARFRNEIPSLGSECLISMDSNSNCQLINVKLEDAVGCGICTYAISDCLFEHLVINGCGEHGIYTHAYKGSLFFDNCCFINCGQDASLFRRRGASACVKFSGGRDQELVALKDFKAFFTDCSFVASLSNQYVATFYSDIPYVEFIRCRWDGVKGYSIVSSALSEQIGQLIELKFIECDNPCSRINSVNTVRRLIRCTNVRNPFADSIELIDCEIQVGYSEAYNNYSAMFKKQYDIPIVCTNCYFVKGPEDIYIENTIIKPRPMVFDRCNWLFSISTTHNNRGSFFLVLHSPDNEQSVNKSISFKSCRISIDQYRLLFCNDMDIQFERCDYQDSYDILIDAQIDHPNRIRVKDMNNPKGRLVARNTIVFDI